MPNRTVAEAKADVERLDQECRLLREQFAAGVAKDQRSLLSRMIEASRELTQAMDEVMRSSGEGYSRMIGGWFSLPGKHGS